MVKIFADSTRLSILIKINLFLLDILTLKSCSYVVSCGVHHDRDESESTLYKDRCQADLKCPRSAPV